MSKETRKTKQRKPILLGADGIPINRSLPEMMDAAESKQTAIRRIDLRRKARSR